MKTKILFLALVALFSFALALTLSGQEMQTLTYYEDDSTKLELDIFLPETTKEMENTPKPVFLFVHGGGFTSGERSAGHTIAKYLATKGFVTVSISYELYMIGKSFSCDGILSEKVKAIQYSANHIWLATAFLVENAATYNIDTTNFFIGGSSAGAEAVLHAQYWNYEQMNWYDEKMPSDFRYAGVVSGAGAIMDLNLITEENAVPTFLFHGSCDKVVPYATAAHHYCPPNSPGWLMLFGSLSIYEHLSKMGESTSLATYCGGGHEKAGILFYENMELIHSFLVRAIQNEKVQEHHIFKAEGDCVALSSRHFCGD
jgi:acetyl esterase/lipase